MNQAISAALQANGASELPANLASAAIAKLRASQDLTMADYQALAMVRPAINKTQFKSMVDEALS
mgnify:CR=1 FL=1